MQWPFVSALLGILAFNSQFSWLALVALAPLFFFFLTEQRLGRLVAGTVLFRLTFLLGTVYFVGDPLLYAISTGLFLGLPITVWFLHKHIPRHLVFISLSVWWTLWDMIQARWTPLPTAIVMWGNAAADTVFLGLGRWGGIAGLTFFVVSINVLGVVAWYFWKTAWRWHWISAAAGIIVALGGIAVGSLADRHRDYANRENQLLLVAVAIDRTYAQPEDIPLSFQQMPDGAMVIVPDNIYESNRENAEAVQAWYRDRARELGRSVLGVMARVRDGQLYKSAGLFAPDGSVSWYDKYHLTITSETWPFGKWRPWYFDKYGSAEDRQSALFDPAYQYQRGAPSALGISGIAFVAPICSELHYPGYIRQLSLYQPEFFIHNSNNQWIKTHLDQYLQLTQRLRKVMAVWRGVPIVVAGVKDYAGVIYPDGQMRMHYPHDGYAALQLNINF